MNIFKKDAIDDLLFGEDEDALVRAARKREYKKIYKHNYLVAYVPGWFLYCNIKRHKNDPEFKKWTPLEKTIIYGVDLGFELAYDSARTLFVYGIYKLGDNLF